MESCDSISIGTVDDLTHIFSISPLGLFGLLQHQCGLLSVLAGAGSQELCSPVKPHPLPTGRQAVDDSDGAAIEVGWPRAQDGAKETIGQVNRRSRYSNTIK